ncbi:MAG: hypothetical protein WD400_00500 [Pontimonas sp.]
MARRTYAHGQSRHSTDSFFRDFFREIPTFIKVVWLTGAIVSLSVTGFILYLLWTLVQGLVG